MFKVHILIDHVGKTFFGEHVETKVIDIQYIYFLYIYSGVELDLKFTLMLEKHFLVSLFKKNYRGAIFYI